MKLVIQSILEHIALCLLRICLGNYLFIQIYKVNVQVVFNVIIIKKREGGLMINEKILTEHMFLHFYF